MKRTTLPLHSFLLFFGLSSAFLACNSNTTQGGNHSDSAQGTNNTSTNNNSSASQNAIASLSGTYSDTAVNGTVRFEQAANNIVRVNVEVTIPAKANQSVAMHLHENGSCADTAKAAGGHWNPTTENHGKWGEGAFHSGDIGNIQLDGSGRGTVQLETDRWSIGGDEKTNILNKSVIVHSGKDDFKTQPSGNAGGRIGCGIIIRSGNQ